jgi:hypothetical protein
MRLLETKKPAEFADFFVIFSKSIQRQANSRCTWLSISGVHALYTIKYWAEQKKPNNTAALAHKLFSIIFISTPQKGIEDNCVATTNRRPPISIRKPLRRYSTNLWATKINCVSFPL